MSAKFTADDSGGDAMVIGPCSGWPSGPHRTDATRYTLQEPRKIDSDLRQLVVRYPTDAATVGELSVNVQQIPESLGSGKTFLIHCSPGIAFHLGHLRMLNELYRLLVSGNRVIILIITYDEHDPANRTINRRLAEEVALTRGFYSGYLGFEEPNLRILTIRDLVFDDEMLRNIQRQYAELYNGGDTAVRYLIEMHGRSWASPNILFVPKCIAAIESLAPDALIAGVKHRPIAECFDTILHERGIDIPSYLFSNLLDLRMKTGMDHRRSVETYIDVSDQEDFILHKLNILAQEPDQRAEWLEHFMEKIWKGAPERVKTGTATVHASESSKILALLKFLANARRLVPYAEQAADDYFKITWSEELYRVVGSNDKTRIERIVKSLYSESPSKSVSIYKILTPGKSGSTVLGVREYDDENAAHISNLSILKLGPANELAQEANNYAGLIAYKRTGAFMAVRTDGVVVDNTSGLVYEDAQRFLGVGVADRLESLNSIFAPGKFTASEIKSKLQDLFANHLYEVFYKHGVKIEVLQIGRYMNEFLPAAYRIMAISVREPSNHGGDEPIRREGSWRGDSISVDVFITESNLLQMIARGYTIGMNDKIDIDLAAVDEAALNAFAPGTILTVTGKVLVSRQQWFRETFASLGARYDGTNLWIDTRYQMADPLPRLEALLEREYRNVMTSTIHGDLHAGNVLLGSGKCAIIDYGRVRENWPALYDAAFLLADLKTHVAADRMNVDGLNTMERSLERKNWRRPKMTDRGFRELLRTFEYEELASEIQSLGSRDLFYALLASVLMGRMKFDLSDDEKRITLVLADWAMRRAN
jgi:Ternary complex associated domain 9